MSLAFEKSGQKYAKMIVFMFSFSFYSKILKQYCKNRGWHGSWPGWVFLYALGVSVIEKFPVLM